MTHLPNTTVRFFFFIVFPQLGWQLLPNLHDIKQTFSSTDVNSQEINADRAKLHKSQEMWSNNAMIIITVVGALKEVNIFSSTKDSDLKGQTLQCHFYSLGKQGYFKFHNYLTLCTLKAPWF